MDEPFLTPCGPIPVPPPLPFARELPTRRPRTGLWVAAGVLALTGAAVTVWATKGKTPPPAVAEATTPAAGSTPAGRAATPFDDQERTDREIEDLIAALAAGHPGAAARLAQVRAVVGDERFLRDLSDCLVRAGVDRRPTAAEWARVAALQNRAELVHKKVTGAD